LRRGESVTREELLGLERARYRLLKIAEDFKAVESTADEPSIRSPRRIKGKHQISG